MLQVLPQLPSSAGLLSGDGTTLLQNANDEDYAQYGIHPTLLPTNFPSDPPVEWTPTRTSTAGVDPRDMMHHTTQDYQQQTPTAPVNLTPKTPSLDTLSGLDASTSISYNQQDPSANSMMPTINRDGNMLPTSCSAIDSRLTPPESLRPSNSRATRSPLSRTTSRAESKIKDVEKLYEFGLDLGILPEDPTLPVSLRRMRAHLSSLVNSNFIDALDDSNESVLEDSTAESMSDWCETAQK